VLLEIIFEIVSESCHDHIDSQSLVLRKVSEYEDSVLNNLWSVDSLVTFLGFGVNVFHGFDFGPELFVIGRQLHD
jgi:hypothetical protein